MDRLVSVEDKIRRAEEIYYRRKQGEIRPVAKVSVNEKKNISLLKKMMIQILICIVIYLCIYVIKNKQYIFSEDFINKVDEILSYDTNFIEIYEGIKNQISNFSVQNYENNEENDELKESKIVAVAGMSNVEQILKTKQKNENKAESTEQKDEEQDNTGEQIQKELTQEEIDIQNIKNTTSFIKPIEGTVTSRYGQIDAERSSNLKEHTGTDIAANYGDKIKSATDGEVVLASEQEGGYGKYIKVQIGEVSIIYAHCNVLYVKQGDKLVQGQEIAEVGSTGNSTGPHLHFEIRISERTINPQKILDI